MGLSEGWEVSGSGTCRLESSTAKCNPHVHSCSSIHDHSNSHCFMKILAGDLLETSYEWPEDGKQQPNSAMKVTAQHSYTRDQVTYISGEHLTQVCVLHTLQHVSLCHHVQMKLVYTVLKTVATLSPLCPFTSTHLHLASARPLMSARGPRRHVESCSTQRMGASAPHCETLESCSSHILL